MSIASTSSKMIDQSQQHQTFDDDRPESSSWVHKNFIVKELLGYGTFGQVYKVVSRSDPDQVFALKEILRGSLPKYVASEIHLLKSLGGKANIMKIFAAYREKERVFLVLDYFPHDNFADIAQTTTTAEIKDYMKNLLIALEYLHKKKIIHRDVKPSNFLYNRKMKRYALIDFGLSQLYIESKVDRRQVSARRNLYNPNNEPSTSKENSNVHYKKIVVNGKIETRKIITPIRVLNPAPSASGNLNSSTISLNREGHVGRKECECLGKRQICGICSSRQRLHVNKAGTPSFRAPEILVMCTEQTPALDIWSAGITFLALFCRKHPIFRPEDDYEALVQLGIIFGTQKFIDFAAEKGISLLFPRIHPGLDLVKFIKAMRGDTFENAKLPCKECQEVIHGNPNGTCFCIDSEEKSIKELPSEERIIFEALRWCLTVDPKKRPCATAILSLIY